MRIYVAHYYRNSFKSKRFDLPDFSIFFSTTFLEYQGIRSKSIFTNHRTANAIQLFVAIKGNFSEQVTAKGNSPDIT